MTMPAYLHQDLDATIAHVVGQGVVALALGCEIHLAVEPHPSGKFFEGTCYARHPGGELPRELSRPLGVAGLVSTLAFLRGSPEEVDPDDVFDRLQSGELELSAADASTAEGFTLADVAFALDVLRTRWPVVEQEVEYMAPIILHGGQRLN